MAEVKGTKKIGGKEYKFERHAGGGRTITTARKGKEVTRDTEAKDRGDVAKRTDTAKGGTTPGGRQYTSITSSYGNNKKTRYKAAGKVNIGDYEKLSGMASMGSSSKYKGDKPIKKGPTTHAVKKRK